MSRSPFTQPNPGEFQQEGQGAQMLGLEAGLMQGLFSDLYSSRGGGGDPFTNMFDNFMGSVMQQALREQFQPFDTAFMKEAREVNIMDKVGDNAAATKAVADAMGQGQEYDRLGIENLPTEQERRAARKDYLHANFQFELNNMSDQDLAKWDKAAVRNPDQLTKLCLMKNINDKFFPDGQPPHTAEFQQALQNMGVPSSEIQTAMADPGKYLKGLQPPRAGTPQTELEKLAEVAQRLP